MMSNDGSTSEIANTPTRYTEANTCQRHSTRQLDFRLVDVNDMCIVPAPWKARYIALSYVWGQTGRPHLKLMSFNAEDLSQLMALKSYASEIPYTIRDAITVVRNLGERYLWIDSLCLLQGDDWELQGRMADLFYEIAEFTIVAAGNENPFEGLEGVPPTTRRTPSKPIKDIAPGLKLTEVSDVDILLQKSVYRTRAWNLHI